MSSRFPIDQWRASQRVGWKLAEVKKELERLGFEVTPTTKHWKAMHPKLKGCPDFLAGIVPFSAHARGKQGEIDPAAIKDIVKAVKWIEEQ